MKTCIKRPVQWSLCWQTARKAWALCHASLVPCPLQAPHSPDHCMLQQHERASRCAQIRLDTPFQQRPILGWEGLTEPGLSIASAGHKLQGDLHFLLPTQGIAPGNLCLRSYAHSKAESSACGPFHGGCDPINLCLRSCAHSNALQVLMDSFTAAVTHVYGPQAVPG